MELLVSRIEIFPKIHRDNDYVCYCVFLLLFLLGRFGVVSSINVMSRHAPKWIGAISNKVGSKSLDGDSMLKNVDLTKAEGATVSTLELRKI